MLNDLVVAVQQDADFAKFYSELAGDVRSQSRAM
jgi:hypothetical protein